MSTAVEIVALLAETQLFSSLGEADRRKLADAMREERFAAGRTIFGRGDEASTLYLVAEGRIRLSVLSVEGRELTFRFATRCDVIGEIAALDGGVRSADASAVTDVRAFSLSQARLKREMELSPAIAHAAVHYLCDRLRETSTQLEEIALYSIERRVARFLVSALRLAGGDLAANAVPLELAMTQAEIALLLGTSRPKVTVALSALETDGAITRSGVTMTCHPGALLRISGQDAE